MADHLSQKYLSEVSQTSQAFSLMDLFMSTEAKRALHRPGAQTTDIYMNFQTVDPAIADWTSSQDMLSVSRMRPVKPTGLMGSISARLFSTTPEDDSEPASTPEKKGKFFAFLQKAEKVDEKVEKVEGPKDLEFSLDDEDIDFGQVPNKD